jgi:DNA-binding transcriptional MerR regulator
VRVGEVAERAGVNVETLRYYERRGLLPEPARTPSGHRRYDADTVRFVRAVKEAQRLGFSLAEIEEYLKVAKRGTVAASETLRVRLAAKIDEIDARLAGLRLVRADLARVVGCGCDSLDHCTCGAGYLARRGRDPRAPQGSTLHVTNGDSVGKTLRRTALGGAVLSWQDVLHEGPVPAGTRAALRSARAEFLAACGWGRRGTIRAGLERRDRQLADALAVGREVVFWFEHDLFDQLQLIDALSLVAGAGVDPASVELIVVGSFPGKPRFRGLGELNADELESLWPQRRPATPEVLSAAVLAWRALRAPDPTALAELALSGTPELPFLAAALVRLLEELPGAGDGLSAVERRALRAVEAGARSAEDAFAVAQDEEAAPFLGDAWFFRTLSILGRGESRLLESAAGEPLAAPPPLGEWEAFGGAGLRLTALGRRVLGGKADRVELLGIDRWVGGVHLLPGAVWRWDAQARALVPPA